MTTNKKRHIEVSLTKSVRNEHCVCLPCFSLWVASLGDDFSEGCGQERVNVVSTFPVSADVLYAILFFICDPIFVTVHYLLDMRLFYPLVVIWIWAFPIV